MCLFTGFTNLTEKVENLKEYISPMTDVLKKHTYNETRIFFYRIYLSWPN